MESSKSPVTVHRARDNRQSGQPMALCNEPDSDQLRYTLQDKLVTCPRCLAKM